MDKAPPQQPCLVSFWGLPFCWLKLKTKKKTNHSDTHWESIWLHHIKNHPFFNIFPLLKLKTNILQSKNFLPYKVCSNLHRPHSWKIWPISHPIFFCSPLYNGWRKLRWIKIMYVCGCYNETPYSNLYELAQVCHLYYLWWDFRDQPI